MSPVGYRTKRPTGRLGKPQLEQNNEKHNNTHGAI